MWRRTWVGLLVALGLATSGTASAAQPDNLAFVDPSNTQAIIDYAGTALTAVLTYDYRGLEDNARLAGEKGTPRYAGQHNGMLDQARSTVTKQKHQLATTVVGAGVRDLRAGSARLVVFLDQTTTRGDTNKTETVGRSAIVDLVLVDGQWKLDNLQVLTP